MQISFLAQREGKNMLKYCIKFRDILEVGVNFAEVSYPFNIRGSYLSETNEILIKISFIVLYLQFSLRNRKMEEVVSC